MEKLWTHTQHGWANAWTSDSKAHAADRATRGVAPLAADHALGAASDRLGTAERTHAHSLELS